MRKAIFLDRDGVLNEAIIRNGRPYPPHDISEVKILSGVKEALSLFRAEGFLIAVITNQPDVSRGQVSKASVESINSYLKMNLDIDLIRTCYHDDLENCECRKPKPGLLFQIANDYEINLGLSFMIGDRWRDIEAGIGAGCKTCFIDYQYNERPPTNFDYKALTLLQAAHFILGKKWKI